MNEFPYCGTKVETRQNNPIELWWPLSLLSILALFDHHQQVIDNRLRRTSSPTTSWSVPGSDRAVVVRTRERGPAVAAQRKGADTPSYLRAAEVADILHVSPKTVSRWAKEGKLPFMKTLGGHRRYPEAKIRELVDQLRAEPTA
jgi:excisionase family DNA binding protein